MSDQYTSSIIINYGDLESVENDFKTLKNIHARQGTFILLERLANYIGDLNQVSGSGEFLRDELLQELRYLINERI